MSSEHGTGCCFSLFASCGALAGFRRRRLMCSPRRAYSSAIFSCGARRRVAGAAPAAQPRAPWGSSIRSILEQKCIPGGVVAVLAVPEKAAAALIHFFQMPITLLFSQLLTLLFSQLPTLLSCSHIAQLTLTSLTAHVAHSSRSHSSSRSDY
jgi:hypothetical protein